MPPAHSSQNIDPNMLAQTVALALGKPTVEIVEWRVQPLSAGVSQVWGEQGIQRVAGLWPGG